ncbi:hypothetical protein [Corallococcus macrosporus]|uniref:Lipoprotein n=1 Tax=Myxococcus fulvus (strain ATCC BAA-855 / HW-1) TaxID=483219 RepID=F8CHM5_MYXFH|nr:hypothetical protein [Corallococcus macrosporus]AEI67526.1 hypothetical protein LILAB_28195 [Corallococcus macrosporus]
MQVKSIVMAVVLAAGFLTGCGVPEEAPEGAAEVESAALCSDCGWLYVRCMSRAQTPEARENCEYGRADCEATWCPGAAPEVEAAGVCETACDTRLDQCLRAGGTVATCFYRHSECINNCPIVDATAPARQ